MSEAARQKLMEIELNTYPPQAEVDGIQLIDCLKNPPARLTPSHLLCKRRIGKFLPFYKRETRVKASSGIRLILSPPLYSPAGGGQEEKAMQLSGFP